MVHHGRASETFWQGMDVAIRQGAKDMDIDLQYNLDANEGLDDQSKIYEKMSSDIEEYCKNGVNGILVTLGDESLLPALEICKTNNIPIAAFNAGLELAKRAGILYFGQDEYQAGYMAGEKLASVETTEKFCCTNHAPGLVSLDDRCKGLVEGVQAKGKANAKELVVDFTDCDAWKSAVLDNCSPDGGDWSTVGLFLGGGEGHHECAIDFLYEYPAAYVAAADVASDLYVGMEAGLNIMFGIDQQSYLQGYMPISFLTLAATNDQMVQNNMISTGLKFVTEPPSKSEHDCAANDYKVCGGDDPMEDGPLETRSSTNGAEFLSGHMTVAATVIAAMALAL